MQLTNQKGAVANLNRFFENNYYFTPRNKRQLEREVRNGTYGNPERIIEYSPAIRKLLWDRNIRYIATIQKTHDTPQAVDEYITNPMRHLVHLSKLHDPPTVKLKSFTTLESQKDAFINATERKQVITFVHKNYPVGSEHFTVIIPKD